jgi:hypothetical protein
MMMEQELLARRRFPEGDQHRSQGKVKRALASFAAALGNSTSAARCRGRRQRGCFLLLQSDARYCKSLDRAMGINEHGQQCSF